MAAIQWHARSDGNHWPLAERLRASLASELFDARIARVDDLNGLPGRAAGGKPVQRFKLRELRRIAAEASTPFVWSDVDVQPLGSLQRLHDAITEALRTDDDLYVQREFADCGCNVGFLIVRPSPRLDAFLETWLRDLEETNALDQKLLNRYLLEYKASITVRRLPSIFWASSAAAPLPPRATRPRIAARSRAKPTVRWTWPITPSLPRSRTRPASPLPPLRTAMARKISRATVG